jgi:hypothetical protein
MENWQQRAGDGMQSTMLYEFSGRGWSGKGVGCLPLHAEIGIVRVY